MLNANYKGNKKNESQQTNAQPIYRNTEISKYRNIEFSKNPLSDLSDLSDSSDKNSLTR